MDLNKILKTKYQFPQEVAEQISKENDEKIRQKLEELELKDPSAGQLYQALVYKAAEAEDELCSYLGRVDCGSEEGVQTLVDEALRLFPPKLGFFLKEEKARQILVQNPPTRLIKVLGYEDVDELLNKEDFYEVYGSLRFVETPEWLNQLIDRYGRLEKDDFEQRAIRVKVLSKKKWHDLAEKFTKKKYHNLTHLKELGVIFAIPRKVSDEVGAILTTFSLLLHYFNEVSTYSEIFYRSSEENFSKNLISALKGEIKQGGNDWMVIPRYLWKDENPDPRLFEPHINPEAIFWKKADQSLMRLAKELSGSSLDFWDDLDWIGKYFRALDSKKQLVTFNSVDISLSFANQLPLKKRYLYHFREALWNKVFSLIHGDPTEYFLGQFK
jgi:hypothetical protein